MRILVVEDSPEHMETAVEIIQAAGHEVVQAMDMHEGIRQLSFRPLDGVITDLFMPDGGFVCGKRDEGADQPRGLSIVLRAHKDGIPCIICTAGFHHGSKHDWICRLGRKFKWPEMVDMEPIDGSTEHINDERPWKDWRMALNKLVDLIEKAKKT